MKSISEYVIGPVRDLSFETENGKQRFRIPSAVVSSIKVERDTTEFVHGFGGMRFQVPVENRITLEITVMGEVEMFLSEVVSYVEGIRKIHFLKKKDEEE